MVTIGVLLLYSFAIVDQFKLPIDDDEWNGRLARSNGAGATRMDITSAFSAAVAERLNYKKIFSVRYSDLDFAPQPEEPHVEARVYIKEL
ncbi:unnamed protein product [Arctia plantaginis]|uniref:Uncharacterized protein n=1 Tax=Arctia plantaginis TaxID=874455 RepID=A0A8S1AL35_ARCPL|nr:unnamed protein product [Arctia plantaginis]